MTFPEGMWGLSLMGRRLTRVTFWLERASRSSSSWSEVGTPNMIPFLMAAALLGRELFIFRPAISEMLRREDCWALLIGVILMSPPRRTTLSLGSPCVATISFPKASRAVMDICLKLGPSSVVLSMTGVKSKSGSRGLFGGRVSAIVPL